MARVPIPAHSIFIMKIRIMINGYYNYYSHSILLKYFNKIVFSVKFSLIIKFKLKTPDKIKCIVTA